MNDCKTVTLRTRPLKNRMLSFYLDYYPGYRDKETMKVIRHESLGIYIYANPKNKREQDFNEVMAEKAEAIRCRRFESAVNERYDFFDKYKLKADFLEYFRNQLRKHDPKWEFVYLHFSNFVHGKCTFEELDIDLCNKFREYLLTAKKLKRNGHITRNSASGYWSTFRGLLKILYRNGLIRNNVNDFLEKIVTEDVVKDYLSVEELYKLAEAPLQEARAQDGIPLLVHDQPAHQRHPRPLLGGHRGLFGRWQVRTHHHQEEPLRGHHPHQRGSTGPDRLQPRQAGNGIQGITAQLDPDLHERVDSFGWNHQEDHIPLLS